MSCRSSSAERGARAILYSTSGGRNDDERYAIRAGMSLSKGEK